MAQFFTENNVYKNKSKKPMSRYIMECLPQGYFFNQTDREWLEYIEQFMEGSINNRNIIEATKKAIHQASKDNIIDFLIDPYELFVDAMIISPDGNIL